MATGDRLARVTYLPGVRPPASPVAAEQAVADLPAAEDVAEASAAESTDTESAVVAPTFDRFFGTAEREAPQAPESQKPTSKTDALGRDRSERRAENVSLSALTRRGMSRWELEKTLLARDLDEGVVSEELERLERVGLIDDVALAETLVRTQHERKGLGRSAITAELRRRHIPQEAIEMALEELDDDDEEAMAFELAAKRAGQLSSYDLETAKRRLTGFLMRKGYSSSIVRNAVDTALLGRSSGVRFR